MNFWCVVAVVGALCMAACGSGGGVEDEPGMLDPENLYPQASLEGMKGLENGGQEGAEGFELSRLYAVEVWGHDHGAQDARGEVFRPRDGLGPARFRETYTFRADGSCSWLALAPNDAHQPVQATCQIDAATGRIMMRAADAQRELTIVALEDGILILAPR